MNTNQVATEILAQMGGAGRLGVMIGAHSFVGDHDALTFKWRAHAKNGATCVKIALSADDTYALTFYVIRKSQGVPAVKAFSCTKGLYAGDLKRVFESSTGLALSL